MNTVSEVAKLLQVSRVTIYNKLKSNSKELNQYVNKIKGITYIENEGIELIKDMIYPNVDLNNFKDNKGTNTSDTEYQELRSNLNSLKDDYIINLKEQIDKLQKEIDIKNNQLNKRDELLENMQVLLKDQQEKTLLIKQQKDNLNWFQRLFKGK